MTKKAWVVVWGDAHLNALDEAESSDIVHRPWKYTTLGLLVRTDPEGVTLAMDQGEDGKFRTRTFIPRLMVIDEWEIPLKKPQKRKRKPPILPEIGVIEG